MVWGERRVSYGYCTMSDCELEQRDDGRWYCVRPGCDLPPLPAAMRRNCAADRRPTDQIPTEPKQKCCLPCVRQLTQQWRERGEPIRSDDEKLRVLAICRECPRWGDGRVAFYLGMATFRCPDGRWAAQPLARYPKTRIISAEMLAADTRRLLPHLADVDVVVGVARSGLLPATLLAVELHRPLYSVSRQHGVEPVGAGRRMDGRKEERPETILVVDDTVARGVILEAVLPSVRATFPGARIRTAAVYAPPSRLDVLDFCAVEYDMPHYLLYNIHNAPVHCRSALFDMDGILCEDFAAEDDDDGPRYLAAMEARPPLWLPRYCPIRIVTARLERYREPTLKWLARHGVEVGELVMGPWPDNAARAGKVAAWKADQYRLRPRARLFVESNPRQAQAIARLTKWPVLCPSLPHVLTG